MIAIIVMIAMVVVMMKMLAVLSYRLMQTRERDGADDNIDDDNNAKGEGTSTKRVCYGRCLV